MNKNRKPFDTRSILVRHLNN